MAGSVSDAEQHSSSESHGTPIDVDSVSASEGYTTVSVSSNVWRFEQENGRTYHGYRAGVYYYPNDPPESVRLDYQSCVLDFAFDGKLHMAPLVSPRNILDVGTGTGAWAIQMGDAYPDAQIEATDLSPIQPTDVPENVQFIIDDAEEEDWAVAENYYDYIHTRVMMGCFEDFKSIIRKGFKYTKPGGWMESLECMNQPFCDDGTMPADWPFKEWTETMAEAASNANRPLHIANKLKKWYTEVGFVDVQEKIIKIPINSWPRDKHLKTLGKYWAENLLAGLQGFSLALFSRVFGWTKIEIEIYLVKVRKSITDHNVHAYTKVYTVWGRKPDTAPKLSDNITHTVSNYSEQIPDTIMPTALSKDTAEVSLPRVSAETLGPSVQPTEDLAVASLPKLSAETLGPSVQPTGDLAVASLPKLSAETLGPSVQPTGDLAVASLPKLSAETLTLGPSVQPTEDLAMASHLTPGASSEAFDRPSTPIATSPAAEIPLPPSAPPSPEQNITNPSNF